MTTKPAGRFKNMPEPSSFRAELNAIIEDYERKNVRWYRLIGADNPLTGNRNHYLTKILGEVVQEGWDYYPSETNCIQNFKEAVTIFQRRNHNVDYSVEDIVATPGVGAAWQLIHNVLLEPGDEIAAITPAHYAGGPVSYMYYLGSKVVQVPMIEEEGWALDIAALRKSITKKTKAIVLDHPNNPTGHIYSEKERKSIVDLAGEHDLLIISDELYGLITYDGNEAPSMATVSPDVPVIAMSSFSKLFMKPGWRIGYLAFHDPQNKIPDVRKVCTRLAETYGHVTSGIPLPILVAATRSLLQMVKNHSNVSWAQDIKGPMDESMAMLKRLQERRDYSYRRLCEIDGISVVKAMASLYMFPKVEAIGKTWKSNEDFILALLKEEKVAFYTGSGFGQGGYGHFRTLFLHNLEVLEEVYNRLDRFMKKHKK
jgi:aspartate/methionine/tyrosine aminotransferase